VFVILSVADAAGARVGLSACGRWGAYFTSGADKGYLNVLSTEIGGPADRAGLKPKDAIDIAVGDSTLRFWELYCAPNYQIIDLTVRRATEKESYPVRMVTGRRLSLWSFLALDVGVLLLLLYACIIAWRKKQAPYDLLFAVVLALIAVGISAEPTRFWAKWVWLTPALVLINLAFPLSVPLWARLAGRFNRPVSPLYTLARRCCDFLTIAAVLVSIGQVVAVFKPGAFLNLVFSRLPSLGPISGAILAASICTVIALASTSQKMMRKQARFVLLSPALLYWATLANAIIQRVSGNYLFSHACLVFRNLTYLILPVILIRSLLVNRYRRTSASDGAARLPFRRFSPSLLFEVAASFPKLVLGTVTVVVFLWILGMILHNLFSHVLYIADLSVPNDFADHGYSPSVEASLLRDDINAYIREAARADVARTHLLPDEIDVSAETPPIVIPQLNVPIDEFSDTAAGLLRLPERLTVTGDLGEPNDSQLRLQLRLRGAIVYDASILLPNGRSKFLLADELFKNASAHLLASVTPYVVASHEYSEEARNHFQSAADDAERITHSDRAVNDPNVILSHLLLTNYYMFNAATDMQVKQGTNLQVAHRIAEIVKERNRYKSYIIENLKDARPFEGGAINHVWRGIWYLGEAQLLYDDQVLYDDMTSNKRTLADEKAVALSNRASRCDKPYGSPALTMSNSLDEYRRFGLDSGKPRSFKSLPTFAAIRRDECQALYEFNVALDLAPDDANARQGLGEYYLWIGERDYLISASEHSEAWQFGSASRREDQEACPQLKRAAMLEPSVGDHWMKLAELYYDEPAGISRENLHSIFEDASHFDRDYFIRASKAFGNLDTNESYAQHLKRADLILGRGSSGPNLQDLLTDRPGQLPAC
jgi:hypothetical protein